MTICTTERRDKICTSAPQAPGTLTDEDRLKLAIGNVHHKMRLGLPYSRHDLVQVVQAALAMIGGQ